MLELAQAVDPGRLGGLTVQEWILLLGAVVSSVVAVVKALEASRRKQENATYSRTVERYADVNGGAKRLKTLLAKQADEDGTREATRKTRKLTKEQLNA